MMAIRQMTILMFAASVVFALLLAAVLYGVSA
jgi:hypothetical protein